MPFYSPPSFLAIIDSGQWSDFSDFTAWQQTVVNGGTTQRQGRAGGVNTGTTSSATALIRASSSQSAGWSRGKTANVINWSKNIAVYVILHQEDATTNGVARVKFGADAATAVQAFANRGIGLSVENAALKGIVHDGSSGATIDLSTSMVDNQVYGVKIVSDGAGNVKWFVDGVSGGTSSGGPTGDGATGDAQIKIEAENNADSASQEIVVASIKIYVEQ